MSWKTKAALAAFCLAGGTGICVAQTANSAPAAASFDDLVGKKLTAIDGSSIALTPAEGGLAREIVSPNGATQKTWFAFINDRLGTVADGNDVRKVTGVFRRVENGFEIEYADGSTEKLALNPGGGLTLESAGAAATVCVSWFPDGHSFSLEERKAALAAFAVKLGLADSNSSGMKNDCGAKLAPAAELKTAAGPVNATAQTRMAAGGGKPGPDAGRLPQALKAGSGAAPVAPPIPTPAPRGLLTTSGRAPAVAAPSTATIAAEAEAIEVRKSDVHPIDPDPAAETKPQVLASATPPVVTGPEQRGASTCLSVESDGMHWGFRNHCGYDVQFAYCLMQGNQLASCHDGAVAGSVAANGFGALVADESLKETDAKHEFRWVACQGGAGEVIPRLDQIEPPSGRCVR